MMATERMSLTPLCDARMCGGLCGEAMMGPLNLTVLIFHGHSASRRRLCIREVYPSSRVDFLKEKVKDSLKDTPDEISLLVGEDVLVDSQVLSDCGIGGDKRLLAIVCYKTPRREWQWEEQWAGFGEGSHCKQPGLFSPFASDTIKDAEDLRFQQQALSAPEVAQMLSKRRQSIGLTPLNWTAEEERLYESGRLSKLDLYCRIIQGKHWKKRSVSLPVAPQATVGEVEERLTAWLGSAPDELVLTNGNAVMDSCKKLEEYQIGTTSKVVAMAWYKDAC